MSVSLNDQEQRDIRRSIEERLHLKSQFSHNFNRLLKQKTPLRRSYAVIVIIALSLVAAGIGFSLWFFENPHRSHPLIMRVFPVLKRVSFVPSHVNQERLARKIHDESVQQIIDMQMTLINQQRTLEYVVQESRGTLSTEARSNIEIIQERLIGDVEQQTQIEARVLELISSVEPSLTDYSDLYREKERFNLILNQYLFITNRIQTGFKSQDIKRVERELMKLRTFVNVYSGTTHESLRLIAKTGTNFLEISDEYLNMLKEGVDSKTVIIYETKLAELNQLIEEMRADANSSTTTVTCEEQDSLCTPALESMQIRFEICENDLSICRGSINTLNNKVVN